MNEFMLKKLESIERDLRGAMLKIQGLELPLLQKQIEQTYDAVMVEVVTRRRTP